VKYFGKEIRKNPLTITGSDNSTFLKVDVANTSSTAIYTSNVQNGYPTSNRWGSNLEGSFFNNFDNTTHVSEILRFMSGVMSHSLDVADAQPNTKYWNTLSTSHTEGSTTSKSSLLNGVLGSTYESARLSQHWTSSAFIDMSETGSYRDVQDYLQLKNWVQASDRGTFGNDTGTNPFHGTYASRIPNTIQTQGTFGTNNFTVTANNGGSSNVSSSADTFGMGALSSGNAVAFQVQIFASHSFSDNYDDQTPDVNSTFTTSSAITYTQSSFGTSNGLTLTKIVTSQPAVIPSAFQDGDFNSVAGPISGRFYTGGATSATNISASGYYATYDIVVGLKSGSMSSFQTKNGTDSNTRFYLYAGGLPTDITDGAPTAVISNLSMIQNSFAATSRSLSGAPYILSLTYNITGSAEVSKSFDPAYGYNSSPLVMSNPTDTWENIGSTTLSNTTVSVTNGGVQSATNNLKVQSADKATTRTTNQIPHRTDICVATASVAFTLDSNTDNVGQNRTANNTLNYQLSFRATGRNWKNSSVTDTTSTLNLYTASLFNQSADSGSMAVYSRAQGYDAGTLGGTSEAFSGEDFRIKINNNVVGFNGDAFTVDSFQTNDEGDNVIGQYDLQVKPGFLVNPTGSYGYWFTGDNLTASSTDYRFYIRRFQISGTKTSMTLNVGNKTLNNWTSTSDGVSAVIIFKSAASGSGVNDTQSVCRIYDPSATTDNLIESNVSADNIKNPFSSAINIYGNTGGSVSSNTYSIPMRNSDGMYLDNSDNEFYVMVRYKGDPSPVTSITTSTS